MRLLQSANILSGAANFRVPAGQYAGFAIRAAGTNQAAQTLTLANLGRITGQWRGSSFLSVSFEQMNVMDQHIGGVAETASTAGAAFTHSCFILSSLSNGADANVFDVTDDDEIYITLDNSGVTGTIVASGTVALFGLPAEGAMAYVPRIFSVTANIAASGRDVFNCPQDNCARVMLFTLTNLNRLQLTKDGLPVYQCSSAEALAASNFDGRNETALTTSSMLYLARSLEFDDTLSDDVRLELEAGSGGANATQIVWISIDPTPDVLDRSRATIQSKWDQKRNRKAQLGKSRAVAVSKALRG